MKENLPQPHGDFTWQQAAQLRRLWIKYHNEVDEQFSEKTLNRFAFEKWRLEQTPEDHSFSEPLEVPDDIVQVVDLKNLSQLSEFVRRKRLQQQKRDRESGK